MPELQFRKHELFARAFLVEPNATKAALAAGYAKSGAGKTGHELLKRHDVMDRLAELRKPEDDAHKAQAQAVLDRIQALAFADARDLTQFRIGSCRYCHGVDHAYQWKTTREYEDALDRARHKLKTGAEEPDDEGRDILTGKKVPSWPLDLGGFGYNLTLQPNARCPECNGLGVPFTTATDTSKLSPQAALLFNGAKQGANGIEIMMQDRSKPLEILARRFGLLKEQVEIDLADKLTAGLAEIISRAAAAAPIRRGYAE